MSIGQIGQYNLCKCGHDYSDHLVDGGKAVCFVHNRTPTSIAYCLCREFEAAGVERETISQAAILAHGVLYTLPRPARHHTILNYFYQAGTPIPSVNEFGRGQGFVTNTGRFVQREEALVIAIKAGQMQWPRPKGHTSARALFSEDLW